MRTNTWVYLTLGLVCLSAGMSGPGGFFSVIAFTTALYLANRSDDEDR